MAKANTLKLIEKELRTTLCRVRKERKLSRAKVAKEIDLSEGAIRWFETGRHGLEVSNLIRLADYIDKLQKASA
jgi:transcriptional regulator with XRE-family HTH domain